MKILYHHRTLGDGAEGVHIAEMVDAFRELGHDVRVLGLAASSDAAARRRWVARLRDRLPSAAFEMAATLGNAVEYVDVRRAIASYAPDLLYKRHARNDVAALLGARHAGVPSVLEVNCLFTGEGYREFEPMALEPIAAALERRALRLASIRLAVSSPLARAIEHASGRPAVVIPNGANPRRFDPAAAHPHRVRERHGLASAFVVGWSGVLRDWHGLDLLLEAIARVPSATLLIVGDGPARADLEAGAARMGVAHRVVITGRVPHGEMPDHIAAMDVAVVAHDRTGVASPMKLLEYMAMARPVVAPRLDNIADVVEDGREGILFAAGDVQQLTAALQRLSADENLRRALGAAGRATIEMRRNWRDIARQVIELARASR